MRENSKIKKYLLISFLVIGLIILGKWGLNRFINHRLPKIIEEKNDTPYSISYDKISFSFFFNSLKVNNVQITPRNTQDTLSRVRFKGNIQEIELQGLSFLELLINKNLKAGEIALVNPDIEVLKAVDKKRHSNHSKLGNSIDIDKIKIKNGHVTIFDPKGNRLQEVYNFNTSVSGVFFGSQTIEKAIPFTYKKFTVSCDSLFSRMNEYQHITIGKIQVTPNYLDVEDVKVIPELSSKAFKNTATTANTQLDVTIPKLRLTDTDWGYDNNDAFYLKIHHIAIDSINFKILDQKEHTVFQEAKKQAEKVIQPLIPFRLDIDTISIDKSYLSALNILQVDNVNIGIKKISNKVHQRLHIQEVALKNPFFNHTPKKKTAKKQSDPTELNDLIQIDSVKIVNAQYALKESQKPENTLEVNNFSLTLKEVQIDDKTVLQKVPFTYKNVAFNTEKIRYNTNKFYDLHADGLQINNDHLTLKNFELASKYSRKKHVSMLALADDIFTIKTKNISLNQFNWGFDAQEVFFLKVKEVNLQQINANIYRNKAPKFNMSIKDLFSKKLRNIPFGLTVSTIKINNSTLAYEEEDEKALAPGKLSFTNFNAQINNIASGYKVKSLPTTRIVVDATFMNAAPLHVDWSFNILDTRERFNIKGTIKNFPAEAMDPFLQPYVKAATTGTLEDLAFDFHGNDDYAVGSFALNHKDLKVTLYRKDGQAKRRILTKIGNWIVRDDSKGKTKEVQIKKVERVKEKSFFNYLWLCVLQGLKQTIL